MQVYFCWTIFADHYYVKIGISHNAFERFPSLLTGMPEPIHHAFILGGFNDVTAREHELRFHERYSEFRRSGEWFAGKLIDGLDLYMDIVREVAVLIEDEPRGVFLHFPSGGMHPHDANEIIINTWKILSTSLVTEKQTDKPGQTWLIYKDNGEGRPLMTPKRSRPKNRVIFDFAELKGPADDEQGELAYEPMYVGGPVANPAL